MMLSLISLISPIMGLLVIICIVIKNWNNTEHKNLKKYVFPLGMLFGTFGYSIAYLTAGAKDDLQRYFDYMEKIKEFGLDIVLKLDTDKLYTQDILFYFVNKTGNPHILPFIVGIIIYSIVFYILFDMIKTSKRKFKTSEIILLSLISVGMISAYGIIRNVRCVLSYVLISFAVYRELVQNKRNIITLLLYILPLGLHTSTIIIVLIRIMSSLLKHFKKWSIIIALLLPQIINFSYAHLRNIGFGAIGNMMKTVINKAYYYLYWTEGGWATAIQNSINDKIIRISGTIFLIIIIIIINIVKKDEEETKTKIIDFPMISYLYFISLFALGCLSIKTGAFWRFEAIVVLFSPVIFITALNLNEKFRKHFTLISIFGTFMFSINLIYQIRNLDATATVFNLITTSGLKILFELIRGLINII